MDSPDFSGVRLAYDTVAEEYASRFPDARAEAPLDRAMVDAFAAAVVDGGGHPRVLDAGCGAGRMSRYLTERGCRVDGVDLSPGMIAMARRDHPDLPFAVASLTDLPFPDDTFAGVMLWYSIIHTPPAGQARIFAEAARVLQPGGHLLVGFQSGHGPRDVGELYKALGFDVELERHNYTADEVAARAGAVGLHEVCRMVRQKRAGERDGQASLLARALDAAPG
ncbi:class I SAM-dependent methyltransferase [Actinoplanes sp. NEAU-A12]|uniref:Class I SAM-dependent methyltransferase n=2 Tax=Actinoplanes sandaracinus TaxID=3045177 RepID=A0ABT6WVE0_9ACTN|nr:class I SAM-dependent methyltransferase [Actinoplanes sandaracinus]